MVKKRKKFTVTHYQINISLEITQPHQFGKLELINSNMQILEYLGATII